MKESKFNLKIVFIAIGITIFLLSCYALKIKGFAIAKTDPQIEEIKQDEVENLASENETKSEENTQLAINENEIQENTNMIKTSLKNNKNINLTTSNENYVTLYFDWNVYDGQVFKSDNQVVENKTPRVEEYSSKHTFSYTLNGDLNLKDVTVKQITFKSNTTANVYSFKGWKIGFDDNDYIIAEANEIISNTTLVERFPAPKGRSQWSNKIPIRGIWEMVQPDPASLTINYTIYNEPTFSNTTNIIETTRPSIQTNQITINQNDSNNNLILQNISNKYITIINNDETLTTYEFGGWQVGSNQTITVDEGATITWRDLVDKYANDGIVDVKTIWNPLSKENTQVEFYLRYDGKIANYEGMAESYSYDSSRYTSNLATHDIIPNLNMPKQTDNPIQGDSTDAQNKAKSINTTIRNLVNTDSSNTYHFFINGFPTDEEIFNSLTETEKTYFKNQGNFDNDLIDKDHYEIRWYVFKYQNGKYRIEGTLARRESLVMLKTIDSITTNGLSNVKYKIYKSDDLNTPLTFLFDDERKIYKYSETGEITELVTNTNGEFIIKDLPEEYTYKIKETAPLEGYIAENIEGTISFSNGDDGEIFYLTTLSAEMTSQLTGFSKYIEVKNNSKTFSNLKFITNWSSSIDGIVPEEAKQKLEIKVYINGILLSNFALSENDKQYAIVEIDSSTNWQKSIEGLNLPLYIDGKEAIYSIKETKIGNVIPKNEGIYNEINGTWKSQDAYEEYIAQSEMQQKENNQSGEVSKITLTMNNDVHLIKIDIHKISYDGLENLDDVIFKLEKLSDDNKTVDESFAAKMFNVTNTNGLTYMSGLKYNTKYLITETQSKQGYYIITEPICIEIQQIPNAKNRLVIYNQDENGSYINTATITTNKLASLDGSAEGLQDILVVKNMAHIELPETGGNGINIYLICGAILIILVFKIKFIYIKKERKLKNENN